MMKNSAPQNRCKWLMRIQFLLCLIFLCSPLVIVHFALPDKTSFVLAMAIILVYYILTIPIYMRAKCPKCGNPLLPIFVNRSERQKTLGRYFRIMLGRRTVCSVCDDIEKQ